MKFLALSGKVLLALGSLAVGLIVYTLSPSARLIPFGYWTAIVVYIAAAEVAWYLTDVQTSRRPRLLSRAGLRGVRRTDYRVTDGSTGFVATLSNGFLDVGANRDVERDIQVSLLSALTHPGSDNRFELIVGPPGVGKTILLHRLGFELLKRKCPVCMLNREPAPAGPAAKALRALARQAPRLFILIDDIELQPAVGRLLDIVLPGSDGMTVVGTCSQQAYNTLLRGAGTASVAPRDLISLGTLHHLGLSPREAQALHEQVTRQMADRPDVTTRQRQTVVAGVTDLLALTISLAHGLRPAAFALAALDELNEAERNLLCGLCIASLCGRAIAHDDLAVAFDQTFASSINGIVNAGLAVIHDRKVYGPHPAIAMILLKTPDLLRDVDLLEIAGSLLHALFERDRLLADAVMRGVLHSLDSEFAARLWARCRDNWIGAADELSPVEVIEVLVPTLSLAGDCNLAVELCRKYLTEEHLADRAAFQLGLCLYHLGSYSAASEIFQRFRLQEPYATTARINCALTDIAQGRYQQAEDCLQALEEADPSLPGIHQLLGYLAELRGQTETAVEQYEEARTQYWYDNAALHRLAKLRTLTGATRDAIRLYEAGLQQDPDHVEYYGGLAAAHHLAGDTRRALVQSARAIQAGIDPALARKAAARAYMAHGIYEPALGELTNCLIYVPDDTQVLVGQCLRNQDDLTGAKEALEKAIALDPQSLTAKQELVGCLRDLQDYDAAAAVVDQILTSQTATSHIYLLAATIAANQGDAQLQAQRAALALEAGDETGWAWFISAQALGGQQAADSYEKAANLLAQTAVTGTRVQSAAAYQAIATCRQKLGDEVAAHQTAVRANNKIISDHYSGEPVFSALLLRAVSGGQFLQQLRQFGLKGRQ